MTNTFWNKAAVIACALVVISLTAQNLAGGTFDWLDYWLLLVVGVEVGFIVAHTMYAPRAINIFWRRGSDE